MNDPYKYEVGVKKVIDEDGEYFQGSVKEFPDLNVYAETYVEAYESIIETIQASISLLTEQNKAIPQPLEVIEGYSGRITLRMPKTLHREISINAKSEGVSLNQYILTAVSHSAGFAAGKKLFQKNEWVLDKQRERRRSEITKSIVSMYENILEPINIQQIEEAPFRVASVSVSMVGGSFEVNKIERSHETPEIDDYYIPVPR